MLERLAEYAAAMLEEGRSVDDVAAWLREEHDDVAVGADVLARATKVPLHDAYLTLAQTPTWQATATQYRTVFPNGKEGLFTSRRGRTFAVGDHLNLPDGPEPPYEPKPGRGTVWRVVDVADDAEITGLVVEPVKELPPDETGAR